MKSPRIHTAGDGRGLREVLLNGERIDRVVFADVKKGRVKVVPYPVSLDKHGNIATRVLRGRVEVRPKQ